MTGPELVLVDSTEEVAAFLSWLGERRPVLAWDLETTGLDPWRDRIRLAQFGDERTGWAFDYGDWRGVVRHVMDRYDRPMVGHNVKYDTSMLEADGVPVPRHLQHDTHHMTHLDNSAGPQGLKGAAVRELGRWAGAGERELKLAMKKAKWTWETIPSSFEPYWTYAALDPVITAGLAGRLWPRVQYARAAYEQEMAVSWVLLDLEQRGLRVDLEYCRARSAVLVAQLEIVEARWPSINLHSSTQVVRGLERDGVKLTKRTRKGQLATDDDVLRAIDHPLARDTLEARDLKKTIGTYLAPFVNLSVGDVLHPNINPHGAEKTGRMSITRPSMQNLPRRKVVRDAIIPRDGNRLILADYQGQEMRLLAHFCREQRMIDAYLGGVDLHTYTAQEIYHVAEPTREQRRVGKQSGFTKVYGGGAEKLALTAGISVPAARSFNRSYDRLFPGVPRFIRDVTRIVKKRAGGRESGWVTSLDGRRIMVPSAKAYKGVNYLIQGSAADVTKRAMIDLDRAGLGDYMVLPVHDEVLFDVPEADVEDVTAAAREMMERDDLRVPLVVETKVVERWGDAYEDE